MGRAAYAVVAWSGRGMQRQKPEEQRWVPFWFLAFEDVLPGRLCLGGERDANRGEVGEEVALDGGAGLRLGVDAGEGGVAQEEGAEGADEAVYEGGLLNLAGVAAHGGPEDGLIASDGYSGGDGGHGVDGGLEVYVVVFAAFAGVAAHEFHEDDAGAQELLRAGGVVEFLRVIWLGLELVEGGKGGLVDFDVVGVAVRAEGVEGDDDLGTDAAHDFEDALCYFFERGVPEAAFVLVIGGAHHAAVAVAEGDEFGVADGFDGAVEFGAAQGGNRGVVAEVFFVDVADVAVGGTDEGGFCAFGDRAGDEWGAADFVVGVGETEQYPFFHVVFSLFSSGRS